MRQEIKPLRWGSFYEPGGVGGHLVSLGRGRHAAGSVGCRSWEGRLDTTWANLGRHWLSSLANTRQAQIGRSWLFSGHLSLWAFQCLYKQHNINYNQYKPDTARMEFRHVSNPTPPHDTPDTRHHITINTNLYSLIVFFQNIVRDCCDQRNTCLSFLDSLTSRIRRKL